MRRTSANLVVTGLLAGAVMVTTCLPASPAAACSIAVPLPLEEAVEDADVVFFGRVITVVDYFENGTPVHAHAVAVEQLFVGSVHERVMISTPRDNGCFGGPIPQKRRLFLLQRSEGRLQTIRYLLPRSDPPRRADIMSLVGPPHAPKAGQSPEVAHLAEQVRRKTWTVRLSAAILGLLLGWQLIGLSRRSRGAVSRRTAARPGP